MQAAKLNSGGGIMENQSTYEEDDDLLFIDLGAGYAHDCSDTELAMTAAEAHIKTDIITDLLVRYWGLGKPINEEERDILMVALDEENKALSGPIHVRALERLKSKGIV